ncbi:hypothetical protein KFE98_06665 [bacterium SCSIO 12741]|nr:hypothetical protein KFE98_06665 [bacterium SCSIO 12741]
MEQLHTLLKLPFIEFYQYAGNNEFLWVLLGLLIAFGILGQWVLYYKCSLPGVASIIPVWNVVIFLKIMGRPAWQSLFLMIPPPIIAYIVLTGDHSMAANVTMVAMMTIMAIFIATVYIELCNCFGKRGIVNYILVILFNGLYVMYLGMSSAEYEGPLYGPKAFKAASA